MAAGRVICPLPETTIFSFIEHLPSDIPKCSITDIPYFVNLAQPGTSLPGWGDNRCRVGRGRKNNLFDDQFDGTARIDPVSGREIDDVHSRPLQDRRSRNRTTVSPSASAPPAMTRSEVARRAGPLSWATTRGL